MSPLWKQLLACTSVPRPPRFPADTIVLFPPRDDAARALQAVVAAATSALKVEMFTYCDASIDTLLHEKASLSGLDFQMTLDSSEARATAAMAKLVAGWGSDVGVRVVTGKSEHGQIIHRKIVIVDHVYVVSGSTNWTHAGEVLEDNELVIRRNPAVAAWYEQILDANFARVKAAMAAKAAA